MSLAVDLHDLLFTAMMIAYVTRSIITPQEAIEGVLLRNSDVHRLLPLVVLPRLRISIKDILFGSHLSGIMYFEGHSVRVSMVARGVFRLDNYVNAAPSGKAHRQPAITPFVDKRL